MIDKARAGEPLEIWGDPTKGMDLIYVKDFCQMIEKALFAPKEASGTYNVGTGVLTSLKIRFTTSWTCSASPTPCRISATVPKSTTA